MKRILVRALLRIIFLLLLVPMAVCSRVLLKRRFLQSEPSDKERTNWQTVSVSSHSVEAYRRLF